ncbi:hypothetical protein V5F49_17875 [Xanthobacter sp. V3C-3]|uniref:hypothetical protein n=1 Tax=Xanthobacter lutulentifluminis TaxID=3119935 RepID=UPI003728DDEC
MNTKIRTHILAAALLAAGLSAATTAARADEYVTAQNKEQHAVAAGQLDDQAELPFGAAATSYERNARTPAHRAPAASTQTDDTNPHWGPAQN